MDLTVYRLPLAGSEVFGTLPAGQSHEVLARTADGWVGFDPGIAQAGNTGLARLRWIQLNASLTPFCLASVDLVTLGDVEHDIGVNNLNPIDMVITSVNLPYTQLEENVYTSFEVTVENQGGGPSSGYEILIFPEYGKGTQNPSDQEAVPDLAAGASHTFTFSPGVVYNSPGNYTLRVLVTDDWNSPSGGPDSIGTSGDIEDTAIQVYQGLCNPFDNLEISSVILNLPSDTRNLPVYLKVSSEIFPGFEPDSSLSNDYSAKLGDVMAYQVSQQGFPDRLYFMFNIPEGWENTAQTFTVWLPDCPEPVYELPAVQIPEPKVTCEVDLNKENCEKAGGTFKESRTTSGGDCICP
jgi:hypothetical protein